MTGRRIGAWAVDYLVICCWAGILALGALVVRAVGGGLPDVLGTLGPAGTQGVFFLLLTFVIGYYLYLTESGGAFGHVGQAQAGFADDGCGR